MCKYSEINQSNYFIYLFILFSILLIPEKWCRVSRRMKILLFAYNTYTNNLPYLCTVKGYKVGARSKI